MRDCLTKEKKESKEQKIIKWFAEGFSLDEALA